MDPAVGAKRPPRRSGRGAWLARPFRALVLIAVIALFIPGGAAGHAASPPALVPLSGTVPSVVLAGLAQRLGALPASHPLSLAVALASRDQQGMDRTLAAIYTPGSPLYHHYLTTAQFNARFGPDPATARAVSAWLRAQGMDVQPWKGGTILDAWTTAGTASAAFHTRISSYRLGRAVRFAVDSDPLIPSALAPDLLAVVGLSQMDDPVNMGRFRAVPAARQGDAPGGGFDPSQIASAYDFSPIYAAGDHGEGMRTSFIELAPYAQTDVTVYAQQYGLNPTVNFIRVDGGSGQILSPEATLDVDLLASAAPSALITIYDAPPTASGLLDSYQAVASADNTNVLSVEWAICEPEAQTIGNGYITSQHQVIKQLAMQGTTVVAASGDSGAYGCGYLDGQDGVPPDLPTKAAVEFPASDPYVLSVGGTTLQLNTTNGTSTISFERAWSCQPSATCSGEGPKGVGTGGGVSTVFTRGDIYGDDLSWQTGPGVQNSYSTGGRQVPDVAASADPNYGYGFYFDNHWYAGGGTSASAPIWSALLLLADQYLVKQGQKPLGWVNPFVYQLANSAPAYPPYHDITTGDNLLQSAALGWDYATGWGSPDAWNFVRDAAGGATPPTPTTVVPPPPPPPATSTPTVRPTSTVPATATATPPPPATATATQHPAATPRPTATPTCAPGTGQTGAWKTLIDSNFARNKAGVWPTGSSASGGAQVTGGSLVVSTAKDRTYTEIPRQQPPVADGQISAVVRAQGAGQWQVGLVARWAAAGQGRARQYVCWLDYEGYTGCTRWSADGRHHTTLFSLLGDPIKPGAYYTLSLRIKVHVLSFSINGRPLQQADDVQPLGPGGWGLYVSGKGGVARGQFARVTFVGQPATAPSTSGTCAARR